MDGPFAMDEEWRVRACIALRGRSRDSLGTDQKHQ
jgi:hypothetical protein